MTTLADARAQVIAGLDEGTTCPCCQQFCKEYKRRLNAGMAAALIWIVRQFEATGQWINVPKEAPRFVLRTKEYGTLKHWRLIESKPNVDDETKRTSGEWRPTEQGIAFVHMRIRVPSHVYLYNNQVRGWADKQVTIAQCLGKKFSYRELMQKTL